MTNDIGVRLALTMLKILPLEIAFMKFEEAFKKYQSEKTEDNKEKLLRASTYFTIRLDMEGKELEEYTEDVLLTSKGADLLRNPIQKDKN